MRNKKIILVVVLCLSVFAMAGCGGKETSSSQADEQQSDVQGQAEELFANGDYEKARELFRDAGNQEMVSECTYLLAKNCLDQKDYTSAISELENIPDYKDVKELLQNARYEYGISLYDKSQYAKAIEQLEQTTDYKETGKYLDKCRMELKYEKFDYDSFATLGDDSVATMTNKEIREYMEECMNSMYSSWYRHDQNNESVVIDKYFMDGKEYGIASWGGEGNFTEFNIYYMDDVENKIHISLSPDFVYMDVADEAPMMLSIGEMLYYNYSSDQAEEYAELNEAQQEAIEAQQPQHTKEEVYAQAQQDVKDSVYSQYNALDFFDAFTTAVTYTWTFESVDTIQYSFDPSSKTHTLGFTVYISEYGLSTKITQRMAAQYVEGDDGRLTRTGLYRVE